MSEADFGIRVEYLGPPGYAAMCAERKALIPQWERDEPVPSLHREVARLHIPPETLEIVEADLQAIGKQIRLMGVHPNDRPFLDLDPGDEPLVSSRLNDFLRTSALLFRQIICTDANTTLKCDLIDFMAFFGPYDAIPYNTCWHRDLQRDWGITYLLPLLGKPTTHSVSQHRNSDFSGDDLKPGKEPAQTHTYDPQVIVAQESTFAAHRGPGPEHNGHTRALLVCMTNDRELGLDMDTER